MYIEKYIYIRIYMRIFRFATVIHIYVYCPTDHRILMMIISLVFLLYFLGFHDFPIPDYLCFRFSLCGGRYYGCYLSYCCLLAFYVAVYDLRLLAFVNKGLEVLALTVLLKVIDLYRMNIIQ